MKTRAFLIAASAAAVLAVATAGLGTIVLAGAALAAPVLNSFTQSELDTNWEADRYFPTAGVTSVSAFGRDDVALIGVDSSQTQPGTFQRTEGIKTVGAQDFGLSVNVDLYVDPDWQDKAVRAGFWVVGDNGIGARDNRFGILEFVNNESCPVADCSNQGNITDHAGWRYWDSFTGWTNLNVPFEYGGWVTLGIELDPGTQQYLYSINGTQVATATGGANFIRELFLNSYNYGLDVFPNLSNNSYAAHWSKTLRYPTNDEQCKNGGWMTLFRADDTPFRNQGACVSYVRTGR